MLVRALGVEKEQDGFVDFPVSAVVVLAIGEVPANHPSRDLVHRLRNNMSFLLV